MYARALPHRFVISRLLIVGCFSLLWQRQANAASPDSAGPDKGSTRDASSELQRERTESPLAGEAPRIQAELARRDTALEVQRRKPQEPHLTASAGALWVNRASTEPTRVKYDAGPGFELAAKIHLTPWLAAHLGGTYEWHTAELLAGAAAPQLIANTRADLQGLTLNAGLEPRWALSDRFSVLAGFAVGWARMSLNKVHLFTADGDVPVRGRSGVMIEFPISAGFSFTLLPGRIQAVLRGRYAPRTQQTGDLFNGGAGAGQTVSPNTGEILLVPGLPQFAASLGMGLSLEVSL